MGPKKLPKPVTSKLQDGVDDESCKEAKSQRQKDESEEKTAGAIAAAQPLVAEKFLVAVPKCAPTDESTTQIGILGTSLDSRNTSSGCNEVKLEEKDVQESLNNDGTFDDD